MNYTFRDITLSEKEFQELEWTLGEHRRICRDQSSSKFGKYRFQLTENLIYKLINEVRNKNIYVK